MIRSSKDGQFKRRKFLELRIKNYVDSLKQTGENSLNINKSFTNYKSPPS